MSFNLFPRESIADELNRTGKKRFYECYRIQFFNPFVIWMVVKFLILIEISSVLIPPMLS